MILLDALLTLVVFLVTILASSAFLSIAFVEGTANSRAGGAVLARRCFAVTMTSSVFLFAIPMLNLVGVYSDGFARSALSVTLSFVVAWSGVVLPMLLCRLAMARVFGAGAGRRSSSSSSLSTSASCLSTILRKLGSICCCCVPARCANCVAMFGRIASSGAAGVVYWACSAALVGGVWISIVLIVSPTDLLRQLTSPSPSPQTQKPSAAEGGAGANDDGRTTVAYDDDDAALHSNLRTPYACRFTANDVHVLKRSGVLNGPVSATGSKSASKDKNPSAAETGAAGEDTGVDALGAATTTSTSTDSPSSGSNSGGDDTDAQKSKKKAQPSMSEQAPEALPLSSADTKTILRSLQSTACGSLRDSLLARLALLGACCVAALSGFAAVSTPVDNLFPYLQRNAVADAERALQRLQVRLQQVLRRWGQVSAEGSRLTLQLQQQRNDERRFYPGQPSTGASGAGPNVALGGGAPQHHQPSSLFMRLGSMITSAVSSSSAASVSGAGGAAAAAQAAERRAMEKRLAELQFEIAGYRYLVSSLAVAIERASATLEVASMGKTRGGMLRAAFGIALSVFGAAKTVNLLLSVTVRRLSGEDAATVALRAIVTAFRMQDLVDVQTMASRVALLLNACLVTSAVRGFLILMFRLSQSKHGPPPGANNNNGNGNGGSASSSSSLSPLPGETTELGGDEASGGVRDGENDDTEEIARRALLFYDDDEQDGNASSASSSLTLGDDGGNESVGRNAAASGALRNRWWYALLFGGPAVDRCAGTLSLVSFSLFMGLHFLGAFVLLRLGFPARSRGVIIEAVGAVPFVPCHSVHDVSFLVAVAATAVVLRVLRRMDDADTATAAGDAADDDDLML